MPKGDWKVALLNQAGSLPLQFAAICGCETFGAVSIHYTAPQMSWQPFPIHLLRCLSSLSSEGDGFFTCLLSYSDLRKLLFALFRRKPFFCLTGKVMLQVLTEKVVAPTAWSHRCRLHCVLCLSLHAGVSHCCLPGIKQQSWAAPTLGKACSLKYCP